MKEGLNPCQVTSPLTERQMCICSYYQYRIPSLPKVTVIGLWGETGEPARNSQRHTKIKSSCLLLTTPGDINLNLLSQFPSRLLMNNGPSHPGHWHSQVLELQPQPLDVGGGDSESTEAVSSSWEQPAWMARRQLWLRDRKHVGAGRSSASTACDSPSQYGIECPKPCPHT